VCLSVEQCPPAEKQHMIDLVKELRQIVVDLPAKVNLPKEDRNKITERMQEISKEMQAFRKRYPLD